MPAKSSRFFKIISARMILVLSLNGVGWVSLVVLDPSEINLRMVLLQELVDGSKDLLGLSLDVERSVLRDLSSQEHHVVELDGLAHSLVCMGAGRRVQGEPRLLWRGGGGRTRPRLASAGSTRHSPIKYTLLFYVREERDLLVLCGACSLQI